MNLPATAGEGAGHSQTGEGPTALGTWGFCTAGAAVPEAARSRHQFETWPCDPLPVCPAPDGLPPSGRNIIEAALNVSDACRALEIEALAGERFAAVGQTVLAALAESGLSSRRTANVVSWFIVAQLALGPWRDRGEVRPAELARAMGVSRWTEWRTRLDAARAGLVRDWTLPDPAARGYGRGAVRVLELAFVRTRQVTERVAANRGERATRAERRREARRWAKAASPVAPPSTVAEPPALLSAPVRREELTSPAAGRLWQMLHRLQPSLAPDGSALPPSHPPPG